MKLLFDENLSFRLVGVLADIYPESAHVRDVGFARRRRSSDLGICAKHGFLLTSKDTDFYDRSVFFGAPPKVLWLRIGNSTVAETADLLRRQYIVIRRFYDDPEATFLPLHRPDSR